MRVRKEGKEKRTAGLLKNTWKNRELVLMGLPAFLLVALFHYVPMYGIVLAFKKFNFVDGILGSPWCGLFNFEFFLKSGKMLRLTMNTLGFNIVFLVLNTTSHVFLAVFLNETIMNGKVRKVLQTVSLLPNFVSWVVCSIIFYNLFNFDYGVINNIIRMFGGEPLHLYGSPNAWYFVLPLANLWKGLGYGSIVYLAACKGIDTELYESAAIDGANSWKRIRYITLPLLKPTIILLTLMSLGHLLNGNTDLFYQLIGNNTRIIQKVDIIDTFVFRSVLNGTDYGLTAAIGLYQSLIGFVLIMIVNRVIKLYDPDYALF